ncbi:MAG: NAD-dependent epimerase/dehydratase family protein [Caulobacteraceae bacterium]|nr:NAD-dependent epimerase/dehydratase family protein [Caulobacter sp.]
MHVLVTGSAGFVGFHVARRLLEAGHAVTGFDNLNPYYDVALKAARHAVLGAFAGFRPVVGALEDMAALEAAIAGSAPDVIIHLAAQAGVRHSLDQPRSYLQSNVVGTFNLIELARQARPRHLLIASTSSVYGANDQMPFGENDRTDHPLTFYAATKKATEVMAHSTAHLWKVPVTAFRFFTVYGPWGRPDMAYYKFVRAAFADEPIEVYGHGRMRRDFTYIDDLVEAVTRLIDRVPVEGAPVGAEDSLSPAAPFRVVNMGGGQPVALLDYIDAIERAVGRPIRRVLIPMQKGDVEATTASTTLLRDLIGFVPATPVDDGIARFVAWFRDHHGLA